MRYDKKMIRSAIKARIDENNEWALYGRRSTSFGLRIPEHHFYMRNNHLSLKVYDSRGEVVDDLGNVVCEYVRKWSARRTNLAYKELMPTIRWA